LRILAIATIQRMPDSEIESYMSDDSSDARSRMRRWRSDQESPFDEPQDVIASVYFACCSSLDLLHLVEWGYPNPWGVTRASDGSVEAVHCLDPDDYENVTPFPISYESIQEARKEVDGDGFPLVLSFPREILTCRTDNDPPNYGRESREGREARVSDGLELHNSLLTQL
jgi:hypothetical protein